MSKEILIELGDGGCNGRMIGRMATGAAGGSERQPMIVAIHGGGFTSAYSDCDGFSPVSWAAAAGCSVFGIDRPGSGESPRLPAGDRPILRHANLLQASIGPVRRERALDAAGIAFLGHTLGSPLPPHILP